MNNRKLMLFTGIILASCLSFTGCKEKKPDDNVVASEAPAQEADPIPTMPGSFASEKDWEDYAAAMEEYAQLEKSDGTYELDQEDKIQDDNYRNFYQIFVYSFCDSNGDGIGDINGITSKLDYIADLGFNGIWLTPIHQSNTYHKYDVLDYMSVDSQFGTMEDFEKLCEECDKRGIKLILDLVMNHTSIKHPWYQQAVASIKDGTYESNKYFSYYNFQKTKKDTKYYAVGSTGFYFEGEFDVGMPDTNLFSEDLRREYEKVVDFWMDKGVGGFRLDAALHFVEDDDEKNIEILKWFNDYVKAKDKDAYIVAEIWTDMTFANEYYKSGIDSVFNYEIGGINSEIIDSVRSKSTATNYVKTMTYFEELIAENSDVSTCIDAPFLSNHDNARLSGMAGSENAIKSDYALLAITKGAYFSYYGDEIGMTGNGENDANFRAPMYWSATDTSSIPKRPSGCNIQTTDHLYGSVEEQLANSTSIANYIKRLNQLRAENPEIARGTTAVMEDVNNTKVLAVSKTYNNETIYIIVNTSEYPAVVNVSKDTYKYDGLYGYASGNEYKVSLDGEKVKLPPSSVAILR